MHPLGMVVRDTVTYLVCTMWEFTDVRQLALHRMQAVTLLDTACRRPDGFSMSIKTSTCQQSNTGRTLSLANGWVRPEADVDFARGRTLHETRAFKNGLSSQCRLCRSGEQRR